MSPGVSRNKEKLGAKTAFAEAAILLLVWHTAQ